jgi:hypothetical protein
MREDWAMVRKRARQFAVGALFVGRLDALDGGLELIGVLHRLRQEMHARSRPPALARARPGFSCETAFKRLLFGARQVIVVAHAERIVDRDDQHLAAARGAAERLTNGLAKASAISSSRATRKESSSR